MRLEWLVPEWPAPPGVRVISTLRAGGVSTGRYASLNLGNHVGDDAAAVIENRRRLRAKAALPAEPCWLAQVHGTRVADLDALAAAQVADAQGPAQLGGAVAAVQVADARGAAAQGAARGAAARPPQADAAFTRSVDRICAILSADCLPLVLATEAGDTVAAAHAGWRGLAAGVIEATVAALAVPPQRLLAWLGPAIGARHFEIGPEVREDLLRADPGAGAAFSPGVGDRCFADLSHLARRRLARAGVARVYGGGECTHSQADRFFSHRRDGPTGRQSTLIWREV